MPLKVKLKLRQLREMRGLTQAELARKTGIRQATISDLETGRSQRISFGFLAALAEVLRVAPKELFD